MPLPEINPIDREYMSHDNDMDPGYGKRAENRRCGAETKQDHNHPKHGKLFAGAECNLERGHLGRHEWLHGTVCKGPYAGRTGVIMSWANAKTS